MKSKEDSYHTDDYIHNLEQDGITFKKLKDCVKLIYLINKKILPCIIKFDIPYTLYHKIVSVTTYQNTQLAYKDFYFIQCKIPGFATSHKQSSIEIATWIYKSNSGYYTSPEQEAYSRACAQAGNIKIHMALYPYMYSGVSSHIYLDCILYFIVNNKPVNESILNSNNPIHISVSTDFDNGSSSYEQHRLNNYFTKKFSKYRRCTVIGYIERSDETKIYKFKPMNIGGLNRIYKCENVINSGDRRGDWNRFSSNKYIDDINISYSSGGTLIEQSQIYKIAETPVTEG